MVLTIATFLLALFIISKHSFYNRLSPFKYAMPAFFTLKIMAGYALYFIYNHYYSNKATGDVNKYFNDAQILYSHINGNWIHFWKVILNIDCNSESIKPYFTFINHWDMNGNSNFISDTRTIIRFNLLLLPISNGYYHFHSVIINILSFTGLTFIYTVFCEENSEKKKLNAIACFLLPSVLFWTSAVLKEGLLIFFLGISVFTTYRLFIQNSTRLVQYSIVLLIGLFGILISKFYVLFALLPAIFYLVISKTAYTSTIKTISVLYGLILLVLFIDSVTNSKILTPLANKQKEFVNVARGGYYFEINANAKIDTIFIDESKSNYIHLNNSDTYTINKNCSATYYKRLELADNFIFKNDYNNAYLIEHLIPANSYIYLPTLNKTFVSLFKVVPVALYNSLFLPTFFGIKNVMYLLPAAENLLMILLLCILIFKHDKIENSQIKFLWFCVLFVLNLYILVGLTTPVLGALVRYKIPALPFLFYILFSLIQIKRIKIKISKDSLA